MNLKSVRKTALAMAVFAFGANAAPSFARANVQPNTKNDSIAADWLALKQATQNTGWVDDKKGNECEYSSYGHSVIYRGHGNSEEDFHVFGKRLKCSRKISFPLPATERKKLRISADVLAENADTAYLAIFKANRQGNLLGTDTLRLPLNGETSATCDIEANEPIGMLGLRFLVRGKPVGRQVYGLKRIRVDADGENLSTLYVDEGEGKILQPDLPVHRIDMTKMDDTDITFSDLFGFKWVNKKRGWTCRNVQYNYSRYCRATSTLNKQKNSLVLTYENSDEDKKEWGRCRPLLHAIKTSFLLPDVPCQKWRMVAEGVGKNLEEAYITLLKIGRQGDALGMDTLHLPTDGQGTATCEMEADGTLAMLGLNFVVCGKPMENQEFALKSLKLYADGADMDTLPVYRCKDWTLNNNEEIGDMTEEYLYHSETALYNIEAALYKYKIAELLRLKQSAVSVLGWSYSPKNSYSRGDKIDETSIPVDSVSDLWVPVTYYVTTLTNPERNEDEAKAGNSTLSFGVHTSFLLPNVPHNTLRIVAKGMAKNIEKAYLAITKISHWGDVLGTDTLQLPASSDKSSLFYNRGKLYAITAYDSTTCTLNAKDIGALGLRICIKGQPVEEQLYELAGLSIWADSLNLDTFAVLCRDKRTLRADARATDVRDGNFGKIKLIKKAKILGLGEAMHGSQGIGQEVMDIMKYRVTQGRCKLLLFERSVSEMMYVNRYVSGDERFTEDVVRRYFTQTLWTDEWCQFFHWLKDYNATQKEKVVVGGLDVNHDLYNLFTDLFQYTYPFVQGDTLGAAYRLCDRYLSYSYRKHIGKDYVYIDSLTDKPRLPFPPAFVDSISRDGYLAQRLGAPEAQLLTAYLRQMNACFDKTDLSWAYEHRDSLMCKNLCTYLNAYHAKRATLYEHLVHLYYPTADLMFIEDTAAGRYARNKFGTDYKVLALCAGQGKHTIGGGPLGAVMTVDTPLYNSVESVMGEQGQQCYLPADRLKGLGYMYFVGNSATRDESFRPQSLAKWADGVLYLHKTNPASVGVGLTGRFTFYGEYVNDFYRACAALYHTPMPEIQETKDGRVMVNGK